MYRKLNVGQEDSKKLVISVVSSSSVVEKNIGVLFESGKKCGEAKERLEKLKEGVLDEAIEKIKRDLNMVKEKMNFLEDKKNEIKEPV